MYLCVLVCIVCWLSQRRIGATEDSDSSSEEPMDGEEVQFEEQDSDSDEDGSHPRRLKSVK